MFRPAMNIVEDAIIDNVDEHNRFLKPKEQLLKRAANRFRAKMRPTEPDDLDFEVICLFAIPGHCFVFISVSANFDIDTSWIFINVEFCIILFQLNQEFLKCEEFVIGDIRVGERRHLVMATPFQLRLLNQTRRWFMDGPLR